MIRKEIDNHLEALAGFINDDDKLVTYKWLSKELKIHVNLAKQILYEYWENQRKEKDAVTATYLLMGYLADGGMRVEVVKEADLLAAKNNFEKIISEHIYSLQKTLPEIELLAITDEVDSQYSAVRCQECVIRSDHEMEVLRWGSNFLAHKSASTNDQQSSTSKIQKQTKVETKTADQTNNVPKESTVKSTATSKPAEKTQKNAFNNMFAKAISKQNKEKAVSHNTKGKGITVKSPPPRNAWFEAAKKPKSENKLSGDQKTVQQQGISASGVSDNIKSKTAVVTDDSNEIPSTKNSLFEAKKKPESEKERSEKNDAADKAAVENKSKEESLESKKNDRKEKSPEKNAGSGKTAGKNKPAPRGKKRQSSAKRESISKKRKRIVIVDSSEEESGSSEVEEIQEPDVPEEQQLPEKVKRCPSPPLVKHVEGRRKVRKLVDKTFMDEDGYFVTQKEYVYESCSDKEEEMQVDIIKPSTSEPAVKNTNKRKQASLLSFFKKS